MFMMKKATVRSLLTRLHISVVPLVLAAALTGCSAPTQTQTSADNDTGTDNNTSVAVEPLQQQDTVGGSGEDLVIQVSDISEQASFYPVEIDGIELEVLAVRASDGSVRTAFNTCQVCYSSGRGYYEQDGDALTCQNCGNSFALDQVENVSSGGCNPVPITSDYKTVTDDSITISYEFLNEAKVIFSNWKAEG
jgi:hypothetical protein